MVNEAGAGCFLLLKRRHETDPYTKNRKKGEMSSRKNNAYLCIDSEGMW
jgi:hypothetical protein